MMSKISSICLLLLVLVVSVVHAQSTTTNTSTSSTSTTEASEPTTSSTTVTTSTTASPPPVSSSTTAAPAAVPSNQVITFRLELKVNEDVATTASKIANSLNASLGCKAENVVVRKISLSEELVSVNVTFRGLSTKGSPKTWSHAFLADVLEKGTLDSLVSSFTYNHFVPSEPVPSGDDIVFTVLFTSDVTPLQAATRIAAAVGNGATANDIETRCSTKRNCSVAFLGDDKVILSHVFLQNVLEIPSASAALGVASYTSSPVNNGNGGGDDDKDETKKIIIAASIVGGVLLLVLILALRGKLCSSEDREKEKERKALLFQTPREELTYPDDLEKYNKIK